MKSRTETIQHGTCYDEECFAQLVDNGCFPFGDTSRYKYRFIFVTY